MYTVSLKIDRDTYEASGDTMFAALMSLPKPRKLTNKGVLTVSNGERKVEQLCQPVKLKRLFFSPTLRSVIAKQLEQTLT